MFLIHVDQQMVLKVKLQYFGHLMQRTDSLEKTMMLGKIKGGRRRDDRGWDGWMASPTQWTWVWVNSRSWWWTGRPGVLRFMGSQRVGHDWATELNWTEWCHIHPSPLFWMPSLSIWIKQTNTQEILPRLPPSEISSFSSLQEQPIQIFILTVTCLLIQLTDYIVPCLNC